MANRLLSRGGVFDVDGCVLEAGDNHAGKVAVIFDQQNVGRTVAVVQNAAQLGEEQVFVEGLLHPALRVAGELRAKRWREHAEDDDGNVRRRRGSCAGAAGSPSR